MRLVTFSEITCFKMCRLQWYYRYQLLLKSPFTYPYFRRWKWIHKIADQFYRGEYQNIEEALKGYDLLTNEEMADIEQEINSFSAKDISFSIDDVLHDRAMGKAMLEIYLRRAVEEDKKLGIEFIASEFYFENPLATINDEGRLDTLRDDKGEMVAHAGLIDQIDRTKDRYFIRERKFPASWTEDDIRMVAWDEQISLYVIGAMASGTFSDMEFGGAIYDAVCKASLKRKNVGKNGEESWEDFAERMRRDYKERPDRYFSRSIQYRSAIELRKVEDDFHSAIADMFNPKINIYRGARRGGMTFAVPCRSCSYKYGCFDESQLSNFVVRENRHEELKDYSKSKGELNGTAAT